MSGDSVNPADTYSRAEQYSLLVLCVEALSALNANCKNALTAACAELRSAASSSTAMEADRLHRCVRARRVCVPRSRFLSRVQASRLSSKCRRLSVAQC
eukprot:COSAG02_NODE_409_length_22892_cov_11.461150_11_plen_99_part_00